MSFDCFVVIIVVFFLALVSSVTKQSTVDQNVLFVFQDTVTALMLYRYLHENRKKKRKRITTGIKT